MDPTRKIRIGIFCITLLLLAIGVVMIYSASAIYADHSYGDSMYFLKRHLISFVIGLVGAILVMGMDYRQLRRFTIPVMVAAVVALILVLIPHWIQSAGGARRWFPIFGFHIQPSEFAKLALILYLADTIAARERRLEDFKGTLRSLLLVSASVIGLVLLQPDLGTAAAMGGTLLLLLFAGGLRIRYFLVLIAVSTLLFILAVWIEPYRMNRVISFIRPWEDMQGAGFQLWQSFLALGSGGLWGVGLGQSQQKLFYLPAAHTDFIFAIIGEELGFIGAGLVILLFAALLVLGFMIVFRCPDRFGQLFSLGLITLIGMESIINVGVSIGAFPTKGLALPFISYGGSSLIVKMLCIGLLLNISRDAKPPPPQRDKRSPAGFEFLRAHLQ